METIITLLLLLLPVIFKLIGKRFETSGQSDKAERMRELAEMFGNNDDDQTEVEYDDDGQVTEVRDVQRVPATPAVAPTPAVVENVVRQTVPQRKPVVKKPILVEEDKKKGEKIDPKKLVIYSEIMKPKFTE